MDSCGRVCIAAVPSEQRRQWGPLASDSGSLPSRSTSHLLSGACRWRRRGDEQTKKKRRAGGRRLLPAHAGVDSRGPGGFEGTEWTVRGGREEVGWPDECVCILMCDCARAHVTVCACARVRADLSVRMYARMHACVHAIESVMSLSLPPSLFHFLCLWTCTHTHEGA